MKKIICAIVAGISVVATFGQAVRTFNSTNELVAAGHNPMSQNTNSFVINTNDMSYQMWTWFQGDTSVASTYNLESLRPGVVGRYKLVENLHWNRAGDVNGDTYVIYSFLTNFVATNVISGASVWTNDAGIVRLINMTLPVKITNSILMSDGGTNALKLISVTDAGYTNGAADVKFQTLNGSGYGAALEAQNQSAFVTAVGGANQMGLRALSHQVTLDSVIAGFRPVVDLGEDNGVMKYAWRSNIVQHSIIRGFESGVGSPNFSILDIYQTDTNSPVVLNQRTGGTAGYSRGFSFQTNGVEVFNVTGTGGPSSGANWTAVGATDSSLAGTARLTGNDSAVQWGPHDTNAPWRNAIAGKLPGVADNADQAFLTTYNSSWNTALNTWNTRDVNGLPCVRMGYEPLWTAGGAVPLGQFEWDLDLAEPGSGVPVWNRSLYVVKQWGTGITTWNIGDKVKIGGDQSQAPVTEFEAWGDNPLLESTNAVILLKIISTNSQGFQFRSNATIRANFAADSTPRVIMGSYDNEPTIICQNNTPIIGINTSGQVSVGTAQTFSGAFTVTGGYTYLGGLRIAGTDANATIYQASGDIDIRADGHNLLMQTDSGNVGIVTPAPTSTLHVAGSFAKSIATGSAVNLGDTNEVYLCNVDAQTVNLPSPVNHRGRVYNIKLIAPATTGTVSTNGAGTDLIEGAGTYSLTASNKYVRVISDNVNWWIIGNN